MDQTGMKAAEPGLPDSFVMNLVQAVDLVFAALNIPEDVYKNPSYQSDATEKMCGLTNTYLQPVRIGRKAILGDTAFYYGRKVDLFPEPYEIVEFDAASDITRFFEKRIAATLTDYMSIQMGNRKLDIDLRKGIITRLVFVGLRSEFVWLKHGNPFRFRDLQRIVMKFNKNKAV